MQVIGELPASSGWRGHIKKRVEPVKQEVQPTICWTNLGDVAVLEVVVAMDVVAEG